ncbi:chaplin [Streptomyces sp. SCL15-6]|uniref:chaplin n=1 Tax=Streptomyces sp. SCL15-6 TaxID=2967222 RepID=UPI00296638A6|nr:chaplin [Streptomyces sp. SCL15-6]
MRQTLSRGVFAAAAATGILSLSGTPALADSIAVGASDDASGLLSGNNVQAPIDVPVNVCGNTVGVLAAFNDAYGNTCGNVSHAGRSGSADGARAVGNTEEASGIASGNSVQAPIHVPVNVCGNTVDALAALNDAYGNACGNVSHADSSSTSSDSGSADGARAVGHTEDSYGLLSGNSVQAPIHVPVNVCGNSVGVLAVLDDAYGNSCGNTSYGSEPGYGTEEELPPAPETPPTTGTPTTPPVRTVDTPPSVGVEEPGETPQLAETGSAGMLTASVAGAALLGGGAMLYRRGRVAARR